MDPDTRALNSFQELWCIPRKYQSLDEMLDSEKLDVISICSPAEFHHAQVATIMKSSSRPDVLFVEKPVCLAEEQLDALADINAGHQTKILVGHTRRFDPEYQRLAERVRSGEFGKLLEGRWTYFGGWLHNGVHAVDTIRMLFDEEPKVVSAKVVGLGRTGDTDLDVELSVAGSPVKLSAFDEWRYQIFDAEFRFELGRVRLLDFGENVFIDRVEVDQNGDRVLTPVPGSLVVCLSSPLASAAEQIDDILSGDRPSKDAGVDLTNAVLTMRTMFEARRIITGDAGSNDLSPRTRQGER